MAKNLRSIIKAFFSLLAFFTSIPVPHKLTNNATMFDHLYLLPIIGFIRGLITIIPLLIAVLTRAENCFLNTFAVIALHFIAQGFIHVDGFIDFSEAILAHRFGINGYNVVKDKYRGSYAIAVFGIYILGLFSSLLILIDKLGSFISIGLILFIEIWSISVMLILSYAGRKPPEGLGRRFSESIKICDIIFSSVLSIILTIIIILIISLDPRYMLSIVISMSISIYISLVSAHRVLGFVNGDVLGFSSELFYLLSLIICWVFTWI